MWLWTVALHMCYRCLTLSLTTVKSWMDWRQISKETCYLIFTENNSDINITNCTSKHSQQNLFKQEVLRFKQFQLFFKLSVINSLQFCLTLCLQCLQFLVVWFIIYLHMPNLFQQWFFQSLCPLFFLSNVSPWKTMKNVFYFI